MFLIRMMILFSAILLLLPGCGTTEKITIEPSELNPASYLEGRVLFEGAPLRNVPLSVAGKVYTTDTAGYFKANNLTGTNVRVQMMHGLYRTVDSLFPLTTANKAVLNMQLRNDSFFPLTVGSYWQYLGSSPFNVQVTGTTVFGGRTWTSVKHTYTTDSSSVVKYFRVSNDTVYEYQTSCGVQSVFFTPNINKNTKVSYTKCTNSGSAAYIGEFYKPEKNILEYFTYPTATLITEKSYRMMRGVGIIRTDAGNMDINDIAAYFIAY